MIWIQISTLDMAEIPMRYYIIWTSCHVMQRATKSREEIQKFLTLEQVVVAVLSVIVVIIGRGFSGVIVIGSEYWNGVGTCLPTAMSLSSASACCWLFSEAERAIFMFK